MQHRKDLEKKLLSKAPLERSRSEDVTGLKQARSPSEEMPRRQSERRKAPPPPANVEGGSLAVTLFSTSSNPKSHTVTHTLHSLLPGHLVCLFSYLQVVVFWYHKTYRGGVFL